ncbi:hypothetical protein [Bradyrhizobium arachidis]|uniref:Uncharacterized protein n=1 Tax=Bradyrhizobium arachidis TaxID=858423 RepID=A0AAE7NNI4_9BRAD|nr:hypothetical protein [Bradyrhizobium arachidis]QOZ69194.1 hypothetical protein WN72_24865 [Bradyrhizobium arachidis]SFV11287.1 hypothetical protein SAMN05192541_1177 [Bradyrhizobium arachidis]
MTDALKQIVQEFETALLAGVRSGADEAGLKSIRDQAFDRLREVKEGSASPCLETIFDVAGEIGAKLDMALKVIES